MHDAGCLGLVGFLVREACVGVLMGGAVFLLFVQSRSQVQAAQVQALG